MIIFPKDAEYYYSEKIVKKNLKLLEKALRKLGNFDKSIPIEITEYRDDGNCWDIIYSVKDLEDTIFEFYNYGLSSHNDKTSNLNRFEKNFHLTMIKANSKFVYKYDFSKIGLICSDFKQGLRMIEISSRPINNRKVSLQIKSYRPLIIEIEENSKKYRLIYDNDQELDLDETLLEDFDNLCLRVLSLKELNIENILTIIKYFPKLSRIYIYIENQEKANVSLDKGIITKYIIKEPNKKVTVKFEDDITRSIERTLDDREIKHTEKIGTENLELLKSDYKRLFKQL